MASHGRINSTDERRRGAYIACPVAIPRRSTKGPLDVDDDPLAALAAQTAPPTSSRLHSPSRPSHSPAPRSRLTSPPPSDTGLPVRLHDHAPLLKDFSFLQDASAYHVLPASTVPPPFLNAPNIPSVASPIDTLLLSGHYRLAAIAAARNLVANTPATDYTTLFHLLHIRLSCLCLINEHALAAQEAKVFGDLNSSFYYRDDGDGGARGHLVPWELRVLVVRLAALGYGEWRKGIMGYYELARECREAFSKAEDDAEKEVWRTRLRDCGVRVANVLVEMGDLEGAGRHLAGLDAGGEEGQDTRLMETLVWLRLGDVAAARRCLASASTSTSTPDALLDGTLHALLHLADGSPSAAVSAFSALRTTFPSDAMVAQNLAVCLLYTGRIAEARSLLQDLVDESAPFHSLVFNLSTIYELCTERNREGKMELARKMAARRGDGGVGWEMSNADFKL
ncbi:uncharacterized protein CC84DRAFT_1162390 [Paraphaeosphaeria sporulosa]|uniref:TPR-like protein n=1 Tax=Paraphaeosphaeria sporulosa TaxID=1460663 RepID=A0A177CNQ1_9PLEO|nr:uncharacterized protein CC84DRAFT_1162390 [Paraphaeosphaeria sporulosa]OAG08439.1 hypothetical protein CC84DRAFT_1162390 [Paraphaeosphaeria sporulosa]